MPEKNLIKKLSDIMEISKKDGEKALKKLNELQEGKKYQTGWRGEEFD